jgi:hypothetical protein
MTESAFETVRHMSRDELESFAIRAALQLRRHRGEAEAGNLFLAVLMGFLLGAIVAASGFLLGLGLA